MVWNNSHTEMLRFLQVFHRGSFWRSRLAKLKFARSETLYRARDRFQLLGQVSKGEIDRATVHKFEEHLDRLESVGGEIEDFRIRESDWYRSRIVSSTGGVAQLRVEPDADAPLVVSRTNFLGHVAEALSYVNRAINLEGSRNMSQKKSAKEILDERNRILATLIDAYLIEQSDIHIVSGDGTHNFLHTGIPRGFKADMSHLEALSRDGKIILIPGSRRGYWKINIPTSVLTQLYRFEPETVESEQGEGRVEGLMSSGVLNQYFYGPVGNVAHGNHQVTQSADMRAGTKDLSFLLNTLNELGMTDQGIDGLKQAIAEDQDESGGYRLGNSVRAFIAATATDTSGQLIAAGAISAFPSVLTTIMQFFG